MLVGLVVFNARKMVVACHDVAAFCECSKLKSESPRNGRISACGLPVPSSATEPLRLIAKSALPKAQANAIIRRDQSRVDVLYESLPYIQKFRGKIIVVKYGGAAMKDAELRASVIADLVLLSCVGLRPVLVHGGGPEINHWLHLLNIEPVFHEGFRVTDAKTMEIVSMVLVGKVNKSLVSLINKAGATAIGLCGMDGRLFMSRPNQNHAQLGFVGDVVKVDPTILRPFINDGQIPVIASVAADESGQSYNINADTVAGELAAALAAEKLILLTDVAGILDDRDDPSSLLRAIDVTEVKRLIEKKKIVGGMIPKVNCCVRSLAHGVRTASIIDGRVQHSLIHEIMSEEGMGTMITGF